MKLSKLNSQLYSCISDHLKAGGYVNKTIVERKYGVNIFNHALLCGLITNVGLSYHTTNLARLYFYHNDFPIHHLQNIKRWFSNKSLDYKRKNLNPIELIGTASCALTDIQLEEIISRYERKNLPRTYIMLCVILDVQITQFKITGDIPSKDEIIRCIDKYTSFLCNDNVRWNESYLIQKT